MNSEPIPNISIGNIYLILNAVAKNGEIETMRLLLQNKEIDPSFNDNAALLLALSMDHEQMAKLLLDHPRVNDSARENNQFKVIEKLLEKIRIPAPEEPTNLPVRSEAFVLASEGGL